MNKPASKFRNMKSDAAKAIRDRVRDTMARHNRCDIELAVLQRDWKNLIDDDHDPLADFKAWCRRHGWKADRAETVPRVIVTR